jgi:hypothetical protein
MKKVVGAVAVGIGAAAIIWGIAKIIKIVKKATPKPSLYNEDELHIGM